VKFRVQERKRKKEVGSRKGQRREEISGIKDLLKPKADWERIRLVVPSGMGSQSCENMRLRTIILACRKDITDCDMIGSLRTRIVRGCGSFNESKRNTCHAG
jgi:hypothetical protein